MTFVIATANPGKLAEFQQLLAPYEVTSAKVLGVTAFPPEDGNSYTANALIKARHVARLTHRITIADDSGLEVDALEGKPGIHSARYGEKNSDEERLVYLLEQLALRQRQEPELMRSARFRCSIVLVWPQADAQEAYQVFTGVSEGVIARQRAQTTGGFGYDPIFISTSLGATFAEVAAEEKHQVSHRGKALKALKAWWQEEHRETLSS